jgi:plastocyanin
MFSIQGVSEMKSIGVRMLVASAAAMWLVGACQPVIPVYEAREITAWSGGGQDTTVIEAFLPERLDVRAGDTVTWKLGGDEIHTVTLLSGAPAPEGGVPVPGGGEEDWMFNPLWSSPSRLPDAPVEVYDGTNFLTSGLMSTHLSSRDLHPISQFSATFSTPGVFKVNCLIHPWMTGVVVVHENSDPNVPSQAEIDAQAKAEEAMHLADIAAAREQGNATIQSEPGPGDTTLWYVRGGGFNVMTSNEKAAAYDFMPKNLTVKAGDTVVWGVAGFHTITFDPLPPPPEPEIVQEVEGGWPWLLFNPEIGMPVKPSPNYDPTQFYHSSDLGPFGFMGSAWSLTFTEPGTYSYFCFYHRYLGMEATIIVE